MAFIVPHCASNYSSDNNLGSCLSSSIHCFSKRPFLYLSQSEFAGSWVLVPSNKHKLHNVVIVERAEAARSMVTLTSPDDAPVLVDAKRSQVIEDVQPARFALAILDMYEYKSECILEAPDLLRLQRARLESLESNHYDFHEKVVGCRENDAGASSPMLLDDSHSCGMVKESNDQRCTRKGEGVAVRSTKCKERSLKRERARAKARKVVAPIAHGLDTGKRQGKFSAPQCSKPDYIGYFLMKNGSEKPKLLTAAEELSLSYKIQDLLVWNSVKKVLQEQLGREPTPTEWADAMCMKFGELSSRLTEANLCKNKMIQCNLRLVISVAKKYKGKGVSLEDLLQEGCRGLIRGCERFDPKKGYKFSTYAHWSIVGAISRALLKSGLLYASVSDSEKMLTIRVAKYDLQSKYGHAPSDVVISKHTRISIGRLRVLSKASKHCRSFDHRLDKDSSWNLADNIADLSVHPECEYLQTFFKEDVDLVLKTLEPRERDILRLHYGLDDGRPRSFEEIRKLLHVSIKRIRQIALKAMLKLKEPEKIEVLRSMLS